MSDDIKYPTVSVLHGGQEIGDLKDIQFPPVRIGVGTANIRSVQRLEIYKGEKPEPMPKDEGTSVEEQLKMDLILYGNSFAYEEEDGTVRRLDPTRVRFAKLLEDS